MRLILLIKTMKIRTSPNNNEIFVFITIFIINACFAGTIPATPENITVTFITPTTVRISWQTMIDLNAHPIEKYIVTYKPTDDRVVQDVAGNSEAVVLDRLSPSTQYSIAVTAIWLGKKYRSRQIIFRTLDSPKVSSQQDFPSGIGVFGRNIGGTMNSSAHSDDVTSTATNTLPNGAHRELPTIRGVEIGIVLIVLMVWAGAIALFFNRWGKIRMLLPYQPDYKHEQLKVPGTGVCSGGVCNGQHSHQFEGSDCGALSYQPLHHSSRHFHMLQEEHSTSLSERCTRNRINSAIFVSSEGKGFDSIEFLRRHGSQSVLCRKAKSAENITDNERKKSISSKQRWRTEESSEAINEQNDNETIETEFQQSCSSKPNDKRTLSVLNSYKELQVSDVGYTAGRSATVTTSNVVIGSISIETPPAHLKFDVLSTEGSNDAQKQLNHSFGNELNNTISATHDSTDTMEEIILLPTGSMSHALVHQCSSTSTNKSQSPTMSPHYSPKSLNMKGVKTKINTLPMVSVSGPSPPDDDIPPSGNL